ncbi:DUF1656 domain-containing protein [Novosphingobium sp. KCTC 2891]|uniref:DUF1656 domain-containing protein n=1 Tax=Novosphingobium sp. KCTC 2891 TaxID=2989730 RepID=UPI002222915F|nr:DUF1656 domain-containing protein [Novosphingobium sp. KCTC 2891]MCW1383573.1 DUF1656 domain-containing protein [Novosphingobium sp. KCTC 2891]
MNTEYTFGDVFVAAPPVNAGIALLIALVLHRLLVAIRFYRWVWHPVLFDTAMFVAIWALMTTWPLPFLHG